MNEVIIVQSSEIGYDRIYSSNSGGWIDLHPLHGEEELGDNLRACKKLADKGYRIQLLPVLVSNEIGLRQELLPDVFGTKNPDVRINGRYIADIKTPIKKLITRTVIKDAIYRAGQQRVEIAIINLDKTQYSFSDIKEALLSTLQPERNKSLQAIWILTNDNNLLIIPRKLAISKLFYKVLDAL